MRPRRPFSKSCTSASANKKCSTAPACANAPTTTRQRLLKRYEFYIDSVQPSVDYMKDRLGTQAIALIDAHQPSYDLQNGVRVLNLKRSIANVVRACVLALTAK